MTYENKRINTIVKEGSDWIPESFEQTAASRTAYTRPTLSESILQAVRMYYNKKTNQITTILHILSYTPHESWGDLPKATRRSIDDLRNHFVQTEGADHESLDAMITDVYTHLQEDTKP